MVFSDTFLVLVRKRRTISEQNSNFLSRHAANNSSIGQMLRLTFAVALVALSFFVFQPLASSEANDEVRIDHAFFLAQLIAHSTVCR